MAGVMLTGGWSPADLFYAAAIPMLLGMLAIAAMGVLYSRVTPLRGAEKIFQP